MAPAPTRKVTVRTPVRVLDLVRSALGPNLSDSDLVRLALAQVAGVDPTDYPVRVGRPPRGERAV